MKKSLFVSSAVLLILTHWMFSGQILTKRSNTTIEQEEMPKISDSKLMTVRVQHFTSQQVTREITIQGQIEPGQSIHVASETVGIVSKIVARKGQRVKAGELLLNLAIDEREAQQQEAQALLKLRQTEYTGVLKLQKRGLQSKTQLAIAEAQLEAAKAFAQRIEVEIKHTQIRAPFDGIINDKFVELGDFMERGNPAMMLVNDSLLLAVGYVPQQSIKNIHKGLTARVKLITGESLSGRISFVSAVADTASRSFRIEVEIDNKAHLFVAGISGEIHIAVEELSGHFLSPAMLALNDTGELGVKTVAADNLVVFRPVSIIRTTQKGAWVSGLPERIQVISLGQGFVREGVKVSTVPDETINNVKVKIPAFSENLNPDSKGRG